MPGITLFCCFLQYDQLYTQYSRGVHLTLYLGLTVIFCYTVSMDAVRIVRLNPEDWKKYREIRLEALKNDPDSFCDIYAEEAKRSDFAGCEGDWDQER